MNPSNRTRLVIDGLIFHSDGNPEPMLTGGVHAANITIAPIFADLSAALDSCMTWQKIAGRSDSGWLIVKQSNDILLAKQSGKAALIMGWQNTLAWENSLDLIDHFHSAGIRIVQLTHNDANFIGDGCAEKRNAGLTNFGRQAVQRMNDVGIAIDLSHCAEATMLDAARLTSKPLLVTHSGAKAVDDRVRNKSDIALKAVAETGGVIGASIHGFLNWNGDPKFPPSLENYVRHVRYIANLVGIEHVGIGTDHACVQDPKEAEPILQMNRDRYPGVSSSFVKAFGNTLSSRYPKEVPSPRKFSGILEALDEHGFSESEIDLVAGQNFLRAFREIWG
ncbi:MAG: membrane dipeptidase [Pusillimonas sp.]